MKDIKYRPIGSGRYWLEFVSSDGVLKGIQFSSLTELKNFLKKNNVTDINKN